MELPDDVLKIIKEFSQPLSRPDWRTLHRMTFDTYYKNLLPYHLIRCKIDDGVMHLVYLRNIHMKVLVTKKEMDISIMERIEWP